MNAPHRAQPMTAPKRRLSRSWLPLTVVLLAAITALSLAPLPQGDGGVVARTDKLQHLIAYGALAMPVALARPRGWLAVLAGLAAWSGAIELLQPLVNRSAHLSDFAANILGLLLGAAAAAALHRFSPPRARPPN